MQTDYGHIPVVRVDELTEAIMNRAHTMDERLAEKAAMAAYKVIEAARTGAEEGEYSSFLDMPEETDEEKTEVSGLLWAVAVGASLIIGGGGGWLLYTLLS